MSMLERQARIGEDAASLANQRFQSRMNDNGGMTGRSDTVPLESTACPLCGSGSASRTPYADPPFHVVRCCDCELWYLNPRLRAEKAAALYESDDYFSGHNEGYADYAAREESLRAGFRALLARFGRLGVTGGRLLEVGSGYGYFLDEARGFFDKRVGLELSQVAAQNAVRLSGAVVHGAIENLRPDEEFDFIFASHVIEHVYDPITFTRQLIARLRPGGTIAYSTPDMNCFWRKVMGRHWPSFKYPEHVCFFDCNSLRRLFMSAKAVEPRRIPIVERFPSSEILIKLGLPAPNISSRISIPLPATTVCMMAHAPKRRGP